MSVAARPRSFSPSSSALHPGTSASGSYQSTNVPDVAVPHCTTQQHNAHRTEEREVFYPWHPWFGLRVFVHDVMTRGSRRTFRCAETADGAARCLEIPEWMFDRVACCGLAQAESPRVDRAALDRLKALIFEVSGGACVAMLEARRRPLSQEGAADATSGPPSSCPTTRSVSTDPSDIRMAPTAFGCSEKSDRTDGAHAARALAPRGGRGGSRRARQ